MYFIASIGIALVLFYGTNLIMEGEMTGGSFASFVTSLLLLYKPVKTLGNTLTSIQTIFVALGRVFELFDIEPDIKNKENPVELEDLHQSIKFNNVSFAYNSEKTVLENINFEAPKGETLAIVGNSGGGKSTLVNLIPRFYDVTGGSITIDGVDIRDISLESLRKNIAMVFQDNFLFTGTIRENIMMGNPDATEEELNQAIESAHLEEMIADLPDGLDTELGERGTTLSGGQRQRVAIARAMVRKSPIVILDEATSGLDIISSQIILDFIKQEKKHGASLIYSTLYMEEAENICDYVVLINNGKVISSGTPEEINKQTKHSNLRDAFFTLIGGIKND